MSEDKFQYAIIRFTYEIRSYEIDDCGGDNRDSPMIIHGQYSSMEEAQKHLSDFAEIIPYSGEWRPKKRIHDYMRTGIFPKMYSVVTGSVADIMKWSSQRSRGIM